MRGSLQTSSAWKEPLPPPLTPKSNVSDFGQSISDRTRVDPSSICPKRTGRGGRPRPRRPTGTRHRARYKTCCVGDDDQSIYGWRGAEVDNILRFEHDFPGATIIRLERNYRSTAHILAAASHLIAHNEGRLGKTLTTRTSRATRCRSPAARIQKKARAIGDEIEQLRERDDGSGSPHPLDEIAILVRASFQMREFEDRFVTLGTPYRVIGGPRFYERQEIRDALAYLRVIHSGADDLAFERIVNVPKRGLGDATVQLLHDHARKLRIPLTEAARAVIETDEAKPKPRGALRDVLASFERWRTQRDALPHTEARPDRARRKRLHRHVAEGPLSRRRRPLENLKELIRSMEEFENLAGFLEHISLVMDTDKSEGEAVSIMTLHSAKGLEFDTVFLPGWRKACFPTSAPSTTRAAPGWRRSAAWRMSGSPARAAQNLFRCQPPHARVMELEHPFSLPGRVAGGGRGGCGIRRGGFGSGYTAASRFDEMTHFGSSYGTPGWQRAQRNKDRRGGGGGFGGDSFSEDADVYPADYPTGDRATASPSPAGAG